MSLFSTTMLLAKLPSLIHLTYQISMCSVTKTHASSPKKRWYFTARSNEMPNTPSQMELRATGYSVNEMQKVPMCPITRAQICRSPCGSAPVLQVSDVVNAGAVVVSEPVVGDV